MKYTLQQEARIMNALKLASDYPLVGIPVYLSAIFGSIAFVQSRNHHNEVYLIWYLNSVFFVVFLGLGVAAEKNNIGVTDICGSYQETCKTVYGMLTNFEDEIALLLMVVAITIVPQMLAYVLSGLSGSASVPKYLWTVEQIVVWSFIKFTASLGGIAIAQPFAKLLTGKTVTVSDFVPGLVYVGIAFTFAMYHFGIFEWWPTFYRKHFEAAEPNTLIRLINRLHRFFTRNIPKEFAP